MSMTSRNETRIVQKFYMWTDHFGTAGVTAPGHARTRICIWGLGGGARGY